MDPGFQGYIAGLRLEPGFAGTVGLAAALAVDGELVIASGRLEQRQFPLAVVNLRQTGGELTGGAATIWIERGATVTGGMLAGGESALIRAERIEIQSPGVVRVGLRGKLELTGDGHPLIGDGALDITTNRPCSVEYTGASSGDVLLAGPLAKQAETLAAWTAGTTETGIALREVIPPLTISNSYVTVAAIDPTAGFAYFGSSIGAYVSKVRLSDFSNVGTLSLDGYGGAIGAAVIDPISGFAYFGSKASTSMVHKVRLADFVCVSSLTLNAGEGYLRSAVIDAAAGFAYFGGGASTGKVVKISLADFTRVGAGTFGTGEGWPYAAVIDDAGEFAYFGTYTDPGRIVKFRLADLSRIGALVLTAGTEGEISSALIDRDGYGYFAAQGYQIGSAIKVRLADMTRVGSVPLSQGSNTTNCYAAALDPTTGYAYFASDFLPSKVAVIRTSDLTHLGVLQLSVGSDGPGSLVIDPSSGYAYFGTWTSPAKVVRLNLGNTTTALSSVTNPSVFGEQLSFLAEVAPVVADATVLTGSVSFLSDGSPIAGCTALSLDAAGRTTCSIPSLPLGTHSIAASYSGSSLGNPSTANLPGGQTVLLPEPLAVTVPASACSGSTGHLASVADYGAAAVYTWNIAGGVITAGAGTAEVTFEAGTVSPVVLSVSVTAGSDSSTGSAMATIAPVPIASISAPAQACAGDTGLTASVADAGPGAAYTWTITGGAITSGQGTPSITFSPAAAASVEIGVTVTSGEGCSATALATVQLAALPSAVVTAPVEVCTGSSGNAAWVPDAGVGATYTWGITNGTITGGAGTRSITFDAGPLGPVTLSATVATQSGCSESESREVVVNTLPAAAITAPASACPMSTANNASVPDAGAGASYAWTITNGTITGPTDARSITFTAGTTGSTSLAVSITTAAGCSASGSASVAIDPLPAATITAPGAVCPGSGGHVASVADAGAGATYSWSIANGSITAGAGTPAIVFEALAGGPISLSVAVVTASGCTASGTGEVAVGEAPAAVITTVASLCAGSAATASVPDAGAGASYAWTVTNGSLVAGQGTSAISYTAGAAGEVGLAVSVTSSLGCSAAGSRLVPLSPMPPAVIAAPALVCAGTQGSASVAEAGAGASYSWLVSNGTLLGGAGTPAITFTPAGAGPVGVSVTVTTAAGCSASGSATVAVGASPAAAIAAPPAVCSASSSHTASVADAGAGATYAWTITNGAITSGAGTRAVTFSAGASGSVTLGVTITTAAGCSAGSSAAVAIVAPPSATITAPSSVKRNASATASVPNAGTGAIYTWTITNGTIMGGQGTPQITFRAPDRKGTLTLQVTVRNSSGCTSTGTRSISIT